MKDRLNFGGISNTIEAGLDIAIKPEAMIFSSYGYSIRVTQNEQSISSVINGEEIEIPQGTSLGALSFFPLENDTTGSQTILCSIKGIRNFFNFLKISGSDFPEELKPEFLGGITNARMGEFSKKIGFSVNPVEGEQDLVEVIGRTQAVEEGFKAFLAKNEGLEKRLLQRAIEISPVWAKIPDGSCTVDLLYPINPVVVSRMKRMSQKMATIWLAAGGMLSVLAASSAEAHDYWMTGVNGLFAGVTLGCAIKNGFFPKIKSAYGNKFFLELDNREIDEQASSRNLS
jgi:hypothetical protein